MKVVERILCGSTISSFFSGGRSYADEAMRSPDEDLSGVLIGRFSQSIVSRLTHYGTGEGSKPLHPYAGEGSKPLHPYAGYAFPIEILGSFGLALAAATCLGKKWKDCTLEVSNGLVLGLLNARLSKTRRGRSYLILVAMLGVFTSMALQKYRNPSLGIKPYLVHGLASTILIPSVYESLVKKQLESKVTKDEDVNLLIRRIFSLCMSYLIVRGIQKMVGKGALKFNWKVTTACYAGLVATDFLFISKKSFLYEA